VDKNLAAVLETTGSLLADHCHANQREAVMVTVIFYRAQSPEESLRGAFDLLKNLREWLEAVGGDFLLSTVELHRLGSPEPEASDGFSELSGGEEEEKVVEALRETGSALTVSVENDWRVGRGRGRKLGYSPVVLQETRSERGETQHERQVVKDRNLLGHHHLHLLLVVGPEQVTPLKAHLSGLRG
jgi:hypothetical protein